MSALMCHQEYVPLVICNQQVTLLLQVPPPALGKELAALLDSSDHADVVFKVEDEEMKAQRVILAARSTIFEAMLNGEMREGREGIVHIKDVRPPVFRALLYFAYTDELPEVCKATIITIPRLCWVLVKVDRM